MAQQSSSIYTSPSPPTYLSLGLLSSHTTVSTLPPLPFPPPPPAINSRVSHSFPPSTFLPPPVITLLYAQPPSPDTANNRSLPFFLSCYFIHHLRQLQGIPHFVWRLGTLTDVATLRRAHHRTFKKYSVVNRTASGTRTRIFDLSTLTFEPLELRRLTSCVIVFCITKSCRAAAPEYLNSQIASASP
jgi:hypothetical protein